ncbi:MAG: (S)-ureidoglycine aminohydrolase [Emergencia sp.]
MSYLNGVMGNRPGLLENRSVIKRENYAVIEPDGLVKNVIPGFEHCETTILASPKLGASFVDYLLHVKPGGACKDGFGGDGIETFLYVFSGSLRVWNGDGETVLTDGGYMFSPEEEALHFVNESEESVRCFLYKRRYDRIEGYAAHTVIGNIHEVEPVLFEGMENAWMKDFLPAATDLGFDMNFHILSFKPGASHGYIETHVQEHGAYIYSGRGMYNLDNQWIPVQKGDYLFMGAYCPQACYAVGDEEEFAYIYSKDCNRDITL